MDIDREALDTRIGELESELAALLFMRDVLYLEAEGFVDIDEDGRCYPGESSCPNHL